MYIYTVGAELPDWTGIYLDGAGNPVDLSTGYTFTVTVRSGDTVHFTKTTGITGAADGLVTIAWATTGELNTLAPGFYTLRFTPRRTSDNKDRDGITTTIGIQA